VLQVQDEHAVIDREDQPAQLLDRPRHRRWRGVVPSSLGRRFN
jgi:hypothetical protein